jgi:hypothetical protein
VDFGANDPAFRTFVSYIDKSREFYAAQGYTIAYRWATNDDAPFSPLAKPLSQCRVGLVTTSSLHAGDRPPGSPPPRPKRPFTHPSSPPPRRMYTADLSWDTEATHTDDTGSFLPIASLQEHAGTGRIGGLNDRFYGVPTTYSQRQTAEDALVIERWCREDGVDVVVLVPL